MTVVWDVQYLKRPVLVASHSSLVSTPLFSHSTLYALPSRSTLSLAALHPQRTLVTPVRRSLSRATAILSLLQA